MKDKSLKIVVIDDDKSFLLSISAMLESLGHSVRGFLCPEVVSAEAVNESDFLLIDVCMPEDRMSGMKYARLLRMSGNLKPIILVSSSPYIGRFATGLDGVAFFDKISFINNIQEIIENYKEITSESANVKISVDSIAESVKKWKA